MGDDMSLEEQKEVAINRYVDLMRIRLMRQEKIKSLIIKSKSQKLNYQVLGLIIQNLISKSKELSINYSSIWLV